MEDEVKVSIICTSYNHREYIQDALESFVNQKTNFVYEAVIIDDASTDNTQEIIQEYAKRYPSIIKPILLKENLYSKNISKQPILEKVVTGKYIAICEGDDYWTDSMKLQKQYDYMESNPDCTMCIHNAIVVNSQRQFLRKVNTCTESRKFTTEEVILGGGGFCVTNSIFTKNELYFKRPGYFNIIDVDYILQIYLSSMGEVFCFQDAMSAYRIGVSVSWSTNINKIKARHEKINHLRLTCAVLETFDEYNEFRYHKTIEKVVEDTLASMSLYQGDLTALKNKSCWDDVAREGIKGKCKLAICILLAWKDKLLGVRNEC